MKLDEFLNQYECVSFNNYEADFGHSDYGCIAFEYYEGKIPEPHGVVIFDKDYNVTYSNSKMFWINGDYYTNLFEIENYDQLRGVIDAFGNTILPCEFTSIDLDTEGDTEPSDRTLICAKSKDGTEQLFNRKGEAVSKKYSHINSCDYDDMFIVRNENYLYSIIDYTGKELLPFKYSKINFVWLNGEAVKYLFVENNDFDKGVIDLKGNVLIPCEYDVIRYLGNDTFILKDTNNKWIIKTVINNKFIGV